jgi:hypothetical protein
MNLKGLTDATGFCAAIEGIGAIPINDNGDLVYPENLTEVQIAQIEKEVLKNFPQAKHSQRDSEHQDYQ